MNKKPTKKIGILGGAGPAATADFFTDIVKIAQNKYGAEQDTDFPEVILYNMGMDGFNETGFADSEAVKNQLIVGVKKLETWGADFVTLPCNTVHFFTKEMREAMSIPLISIVESTVLEIKNRGIKKVGIISSRSTRDLELYKKAIEGAGVETVVATDREQEILDTIVLQVMSGKQGLKETTEMKEMIDRMTNDGAEGIVLGCTELPLAITQNDSDIPLYNTIHILAERAVYESYN